MSGGAVPADRSLPRVVTALGIAQIVSWGTLFYTIAVLGPPMRADLGVGEVWLFGSFTAGLAVSGLLSPAVGRAIDARGGRRVLAAGSLLGAAACAALALAQGPLSVRQSFDRTTLAVDERITARIELESFNGDIRLCRPGQLSKTGHQDHDEDQEEK